MVKTIKNTENKENLPPNSANNKTLIPATKLANRNLAIINHLTLKIKETKKTKDACKVRNINNLYL